MTGLELTLLLLCAAVLGVVVFRLLHLPPMLGYLVIGILIGPHSLGWVPASPQTSYLAEFGVVFLMFSIGLEFSLPKLNSMRRIVFGLGLAQVFLTILLVMVPTILILWLAPQWNHWGISWQAALIMGGALAMSSTAIVSKMMAERMEIDSPHGKQVFGVLLFQDLAVVPLLIMIPALSAPAETMMVMLGLAMLKAILVLTVLLGFGQKFMRFWLHQVAKRRSQELFMLNLLLIALGLAWITEHAGLSLALGAFVAGMLISETPYRHQVEEDIKPFRDVLLGLFFITIGMLLDVRVVVQQMGWVLVFLCVPILLKFGMITLLARVFAVPTGTALRTGLYLAQAGEFGFVLLNQAVLQAGGKGFIPDHLLQLILASMLLSMLIAPFLIQYSDRIVLKLSSQEWMLQALQLHQIAAKAVATEKHVLICGYGRSGQHLARLLEQENIRYVALDLDPDRVREAAAAGESAVYGDAARREALLAAGLTRAAAVVVSYADTSSALKVLRHVREHAPAVPVIVRTHDDADLQLLQQAGATEVVPELIEGSLMLASHALVLLGQPLHRVVRRVQQARDARYQLLRGFFHGADDVEDDLEHESIRLHSVSLSAEVAAIGKTLQALDLQHLNVEVASLRRGDQRTQQPSAETTLMTGDILVLRGNQEALALAEQRLLER